MKKREKQQILNLIKTMDRANQNLISLYKRNDRSTLISVLADEQESAILIGNRIEEIEGEEAQVVFLLEEYCELLWKITQEKGEKQYKTNIELLMFKLNQIKKLIEEFQETEKIEVVFLPYNASMWDCMETVWKAVKNDSGCNVYVIPIPYYELNPDGSVGEEHYEGMMFPEDVPIISYKQYNLQKHHPDVIYIHNPYDEYNRVTRVHPDFYCSVLRNYTDMLVYIPYFITNGRMPETHNYLPAYIYADKIILQTEEMIDDIHPDIPREKFLVLGSPKEERILWMETHKEQLDFPDEWKKKAEGKKVILFNVSISALLKLQDKMLDKIEEVFKAVGLRDDLILLWRPHPLLEATLSSMCMELVERYRKLMRWYKKKNIGILDQTADPGKAVVFADAYIGEKSSSIVELFRLVEKPRFFTAEKTYYQPTIDELKSEITYDICKLGEKLWFVTGELQMLCMYNLQSEKLEVIAPIPEVKSMSYVYVAGFEKKIILVPDKGTALCIYDVEKGEFVKKYFVDEYANDCFAGLVVYQKYLYLTPGNYPALVQFNMSTGEFQYFDQCIKDMLEEIKPKKQGYVFGWGLSSYDTQLYIASMHSNHVLIFDMETYSYEIRRIGEAADVYRGMVSDETYNWLITQDNPHIIRWNRETDEVTEYGIFPKGFYAGPAPFKNILDFGDRLYMFPRSANHICQLDKVSGEVSFARFELPFEEGAFASQFFEEQKQPYAFAKRITDSEMAVMSLYDNRLLVINTVTGECKSKKVRIENRLYWEFRRKERLLTEVWESDEMQISKYLECIGSELGDKLYKKGTWRQIGGLEKHIGENIHQEIKKIIITGGESNRV